MEFCLSTIAPWLLAATTLGTFFRANFFLLFGAFFRANFFWFFGALFDAACVFATNVQNRLIVNNNCEQKQEE